MSRKTKEHDKGGKEREARFEPTGYEVVNITDRGLLKKLPDGDQVDLVHLFKGEREQRVLIISTPGTDIFQAIYLPRDERKPADPLQAYVVSRVAESIRKLHYAGTLAIDAFGTFAYEGKVSLVREGWAIIVQDLEGDEAIEWQRKKFDDIRNAYDGPIGWAMLGLAAEA